MENDHSHRPWRKPLLVGLFIWLFVVVAVLWYYLANWPLTV